MFRLAGFKKQVLNKHHPQTKSLYLLSSCKSYIKTEAKNLANFTALFQENTINWLCEKTCLQHMLRLLYSLPCFREEKEMLPFQYV